MITYVRGDIFQSPAQVLVNAVNTVGVMGKGIALQFRQLFPDMFRQYQIMCEQGSFEIGNLWLYQTHNKWILNFPTKRHWRQPSKEEYIEAGLLKFVDSYSAMRINSIAFPPIGCGNGQLDFKTQVQPMMEKYLGPLPIDVFVYPERDNKFIEHKQPAEMKKWLSEEPESLPFTEVWEDLRTILQQKSRFLTIKLSSEFQVKVHDSPPALIIVHSNGERSTIPYDALLSIWQQLRNHGFSMRYIAPGLDRDMSYLLPVFSELPYVSAVEVADKYDLLSSHLTIGLQILPSELEQRAVAMTRFRQLSLI